MSDVNALGHIIAWYDRVDNKVVPIGEEDKLVSRVPAHILRAIKRNDDADLRHKGPNVTVTAGTSCPRATYITHMLPWVCDFTNMFAVTWGGILHDKVAEWNDEPGWKNERSDRQGCVVRGELFGVEMTGGIDRRPDDWSKIHDYKFGFSGGTKWSSGLPSPEHHGQVSMYAYLAVQTHNIPLPQELLVWRVDSKMIGEGPVAPLPLELIEVHKPHGGEMTTGEIFRMLRDAYASDAEPREVAKSLPLTGKTMTFGKYRTPSCEWCACKPTCDFLLEEAAYEAGG